jgi:hypothetical protein
VRLSATLQHAGRLTWEPPNSCFAPQVRRPRNATKVQRYLRDMAMYRGHIAAQFMNTATTVAGAHFWDAFPHDPLGGGSPRSPGRVVVPENTNLEVQMVLALAWENPVIPCVRPS